MVWVSQSTLGHSINWQVMALGMRYVRLDYSICWQVHNPRMAVGFVGKFWALLCRAAAPTGYLKVSGCARLVKAAVPNSIYVRVGMTELNCCTCRCELEPDGMRDRKS